MNNNLIRILIGSVMLPSIMYAPLMYNEGVNTASAAAAPISTGFSSSAATTTIAAASSSSSSSSSNAALSVIAQFNRRNNNKKLFNLFSNSGTSPVIYSIFDFALGSISKHDSTFIELRKTEDPFIETQLAGYLKSKSKLALEAVERTIDQMLVCNSFDDFDMLEDDLDIWKRLPLLRNILINIANDVHHAFLARDEDYNSLSPEAEYAKSIFKAMRSQGFTANCDHRTNDNIIYKKTDKQIKGIIYYSIVILRALIMAADNYKQEDVNADGVPVLRVNFDIDEQNKRKYNQMLKERMVTLVAKGDKVYEFLNSSNDKTYQVIFQIMLIDESFEKFEEEFLMEPECLHHYNNLLDLVYGMIYRKSVYRNYSHVAIDEIANHVSIHLCISMSSHFECCVVDKFVKRSTKKELLKWVEEKLKSSVEGTNFYEFGLIFHFIRYVLPDYQRYKLSAIQNLTNEYRIYNAL